MKTHTINTYSFNELSEQTKQKVIEKMHDINTSHEWHEPIYEGIFEDVKEKGFNIEDIYFSGFWSQGDGAMFEYSGIDNKLKEQFINGLKLSNMRKEWLKNNIYTSANGKHSGHYYHENCCNHVINWEIDNGDIPHYSNFRNWLESFNEDFEKFVIDIYKDICRDIYKRLEKEYDYLTSKEAIIETIEANEYEFTENGNLY